jgi:uncharacterized protein (DUF924 family)
VLDFWFREVGTHSWFASNEELDERIRRRFLRLHEQITMNDSHDFAGPRTVLAGIIVLDQFSRNMFRSTARAFSADSLARRLAAQVVSLGLDGQMTPEERYFAYLPFSHSEDRTHQALAVGLIEQLGSDDWTSWARSHRLVISRFGRFPHRNAILSRASTPEELAYLDEPMPAF